VSRAPTSDQLTDTRVGSDDEPAPSIRPAGGTIEMIGHSGVVARLDLRVDGDDGLEVTATVEGRRSARTSRRLTRDAAIALVGELAELVESEPGESLPGSSGSLAIRVAFGRRIVAARIDGQTGDRLGRVADRVLREIVLCGVALSPDLHPISPDDDDDDDTLVR
jgi:hypothetical protein